MGAAAGKSLQASEANHDQGNSGGDMGYMGDIGKHYSGGSQIVNAATTNPNSMTA